MDSFYYREYLLRLRKTELEEVDIQVLDDQSPKLKNILRMIIDLDFTEGRYDTYYGHVKNYVTGFINLWDNTIDEAIKKADEYSQITDRDGYLDLIQKTIDIHHKKQIDFVQEILPISSKDREVCEIIESKYNENVWALTTLKSEVAAVGAIHFKVEVVEKQMKISIRKMYDIFEFTHTYIAMYLADQLDKLKTSLEEISRRINHNYERITTERDKSLNALMIQLYDKNKEQLNITRKDRASISEVAEIRKAIDNLVFSIEMRCQNPKPSVGNLEQEIKHWDRKVQEFNRLYTALKKSKEDLNHVCAQEKIYEERRTTEFPGSSKKRDWEAIGSNFRERKVALNGLILENAKALISFFGLKGVSVMLYTDNVGPYYRDHYGHQVYWLKDGLQEYHAGDDEDRRCFMVPYNQMYYYDSIARYVLDESSTPLYQRGRCASFYKLDAEHTLVRVQAAPGERCGDKPQEELPEIKVEKTLEPEAAAYLWSTFGPTLPEALADVITARPRNPFHYLAHRLLRIKYARSKKDTEIKAAENEKYRSDIFDKRKEKAIAESKAYRSTLPRRSKPDDSDDRDDWQLYNVQLAERELMTQLQYSVDDYPVTSHQPAARPPLSPPAPPRRATLKTTN